MIYMVKNIGLIFAKGKMDLRVEKIIQNEDPDLKSMNLSGDLIR